MRCRKWHQAWPESVLIPLSRGLPVTQLLRGVCPLREHGAPALSD